MNPCDAGHAGPVDVRPRRQAAHRLGRLAAAAGGRRHRRDRRPDRLHRARKKDAFLIDSGHRADSPGVRRGVVQRCDGTEERSYGNSAGLGLGEAGFDAAEWKTRVDATGGDVAAAVRGWMVDTGRLAPDAALTHLEVRGWTPAD
jgi:hypothetical protein